MARSLRDRRRAALFLATITVVAHTSIVSCGRRGDASEVDAGALREAAAFHDGHDVTYGRIPEGWVPFDGYSHECALIVPSAREYLPPPVQWESCPMIPSVPSLACRQMTLDWPDVSGEVTAGTKGFRDASGRLLLMTAFFPDPQRLRIVVDPDGPTENAILEVSPVNCTLGEAPPLRDDRFIWSVIEMNPEAGGGRQLGAIAGRVGDVAPRVLLHYHDDASHDFLPGAPGVLQQKFGEPMELRAWSNGAYVEPLPGQLGYGGFVGDTFLQIDNDYAKVTTWSPVDGARTLLTVDGDHALGGFGTDGTDMVWLEANRTSDSSLYRAPQVVSSPFTTDPGALKRHVLLTDLAPYGFDSSPFVVGCGYAARTLSFSDDGGVVEGTYVVRLSDGRRWHLPFERTPLAFGPPVALTCDDLFLLGGQGAVERVLRVRLDSLGPGEAP